MPFGPSCSPDFGINGVLDRFGQIQPKVLFGCDGYLYNGKTIDSLPRVEEIAGHIDSLQKLVVVPVIGGDCGDMFSRVENALSYADFTATSLATELSFEQLPFDHPLYIVYSSGTTGVPKCIVHGVGGR